MTDPHRGNCFSTDFGFVFLSDTAKKMQSLVGHDQNQYLQTNNDIIRTYVIRLGRVEESGFD